MYDVRFLQLMELQVKYTESGKISSIRGLEWPWGFQEVKVPTFHDNGT